MKKKQLCWLIAFLSVSLIISRCAGPKSHTINQGYANLDSSGQPSTGKMLFKCTHPPKRYARELELKVKNSIDSLGQLSVGDLELAFASKVQKLTDYSSEGLDLALTHFYLCQMANNKSLTNEQLYRLDSIAIKAWENIKTSKKEKIRPKNNYRIDQEKISDSQYVVTATPLVGQWLQPYYALQIAEYTDENRPELIDKYNLGTQSIITDATIPTKPRVTAVKVLFCRITATPNYNYSLTMKQPVSKIFFGDWQDSTQNFFMDR